MDRFPEWRRAEHDRGQRAGPFTQEWARLEAFERKVRALREAYETLRKTSASVAPAELHRRFKP